MTTSTVPRTPIVSVKPVVLDAAGRDPGLHVRVSAPTTGERLPVVVFSHGNGWSMDGYAPLADHWAGEGLVVVQPTHLDSRSVGLAPDDLRFASVWRQRVTDLTTIIDRLEDLVAAVPGLAGRVDTAAVAVAGHSWGAQTAGMLLGARVLDEAGTPGEDLRDPRVRAGVLLAATGTGESLTPFAAEHQPFMRPSYPHLTTPTLVVAGGSDRSALSTRGPDWFTDAYTLSPGATAMLTLPGGEHSLGGIVGHEVAETTDPDPARVRIIQRVTTAFLRTQLGLDAAAWPAAVADVEREAGAAARISSR
ncbi:alpha/beta hydrolase family protein [Puerhibacterium puerhi]|uniref:alpha/beta hydrolase family protein n=1 Tax=Puerhibacterium puerhi TaxID=2692623 RepID=UPI00135882ED|nr:chlorophyllase [Puerhibacterium puerhi]